MKILIADDSAPVRLLVSSVVEDAGYETVCVENGREAWDRIKGEDIRLGQTYESAKKRYETWAAEHGARTDDVMTPEITALETELAAVRDQLQQR